jgi:hypothetical protein
MDELETARSFGPESEGRPAMTKDRFYGGRWLARAALVALALGGFPPCSSFGAARTAGLYFEKNLGQWRSEVRYAMRSGAGAVGVVPDGALFLNSGHDRPVRLRLLGSKSAADIEGEGPLAFRTHRFIGSDPDRWITDIPGFRNVVAHSVYPGIDLAFRGGPELEYDFVVHPGARPADIRFRFEGTPPPTLDRNGDLLVADGAIRMKPPVAYQAAPAGPEPVCAQYWIRGSEVSVAVGPYDASRTLVVDPVVIGYSTFLGGTGADNASAIAVDTDRNVYLSGSSASNDFPAGRGGESFPRSGPNDTWVAKLDPLGQLVFVAFLGGSGDDGSLFRDVAVDSTGAVYVASSTSSTDFPTTADAPQRTYGGGTKDGFVAKLSPDGSRLLASTYLGGGGLDRLDGMALDAFRNVYVGGFTESSDFPTTEGAYQRELRGSADAFVAKLSFDPFDVVYSTLLGGSDKDQGRKVAVDLSGAAYLGGNTFSADYPVTAGVVQTVYAGPGTGSNVYGDVFLTKLDPTGSSAVWSTFLGGSGGDVLDSLVIDRTGAPFLSGLTCSDDFPATGNAFQTALRGQCDGFAAGISSDGGTLIASTYLGGLNDSGTDEAWGIALDPRGNICVGGSTSCSDFPVTGDAVQGTIAGGKHDGIFAVLAPDGSSLLHSSFLGGSAPPENVFAIAVDRAGNLYLVGSTQSTDFPVTADALQKVNAGQEDAFFTKILREPPTVEGERSIVPAVASTEGVLGSNFKTSVQLHNPTDGEIEGRFVFHPQGIAAAPGDPSLYYLLEPRETVAFMDLLPTMGAAGLGSLDLITPQGEAPVSLVRVYNDAGADGTAGLFEERVAPLDAPGPGMTPVLIAPISLDRSRFNIGIRSLAEGATLTATVRHSDGSVAGSRTLSYPPDEFVQSEASGLLGVALAANDSIAFHIDAGSAVIYGATTDNTTQDPSVQFAKVVDSVEGERRILPGVASLTGLSESHFKTSLQLHDASDEPMKGRLEYYAARSADAAPSPITLEYDLDPGQTTAYEDLLPALGTEGIGSLDIVSTAGPLPLTVARIYADAGEKGTTGMTEDQVPLDRVLRKGDRGILIGSADPARARFNIGIRSLEDGAEITATVRNAAGIVVHEATLGYPANDFVQAPAATLLGAAFVGGESVEFRVDSGSAILYGAITDNISQDPTMMVARRQ